MRLLKTIAIGTLATAAAVSAQAAPLTSSQILNQFNAVVTGEVSTTSDIEGRLVAGDVVKGATFYNKPRGTASDYSAINAVKISATGSMNINNGGGANYLTTNAGSFNLNGGGSIKQGVPTFSMSDFSTPLNALEAQLAGLSSANSLLNATDPNNFNFKLTGTATSTSVFNITTTELASARTINFSGTANTVIINVRYDGVIGNDGAKALTIDGNFNDNSQLGSRIIWNFVDTTAINFKGWYGTVLAGTSDVHAGSAMNGFLYAESYTGPGELHDRAFLGTLPAAVPEPSTWAMMGIGLVGLALVRRRQNKA